jgi:hypothetical protein
MQTCKADLYFYPHKTTAISKEKNETTRNYIPSLSKKVYNEKKSLRTKKVEKKIVN